MPSDFAKISPHVQERHTSCIALLRKYLRGAQVCIIKCGCEMQMNEWSRGERHRPSVAALFRCTVRIGCSLSLLFHITLGCKIYISVQYYFSEETAQFYKEKVWFSSIMAVV